MILVEGFIGPRDRREQSSPFHVGGRTVERIIETFELGRSEAHQRFIGATLGDQEVRGADHVPHRNDVAQFIVSATGLLGFVQ